MNQIRVELFLQEYLLKNRPCPFTTLVGAGQEPNSTAYLVFREPGTFRDLVVVTKFVKEESPTKRGGIHWEHAMYSGASWRMQMRHQTKQSETRNGIQGPSSLILTASFTNQFGLELVGHVDESPMEDVQFRTMSIEPTPFVAPPTLEYTNILDEAPIYRWVSQDSDEAVNNLIGVVVSATPRDPTGAVYKEGHTRAQASLSLGAHSAIVERNDSTVMRPTFHAKLSIPETPRSIWCPTKTYIPLSDSTRSFLQGALLKPSLPMRNEKAFDTTAATIGCATSYQEVNDDYHLVGSILNNIFDEENEEKDENEWNFASNQSNQIPDPGRILRASTNQQSETNPSKQIAFSYKDAALTKPEDPNKPRQPKELKDENWPELPNRRQNHFTIGSSDDDTGGNAGESRSDVSALRGSEDKDPASENREEVSRSLVGDIAINLLCPYQNPSGFKTFSISHETPHQTAFRRTIETSPYCQHLMKGRYSLNHLIRKRLDPAYDW